MQGKEAGKGTKTELNQRPGKELIKLKRNRYSQLIKKQHASRHVLRQSTRS